MAFSVMPYNGEGISRDILVPPWFVDNVVFLVYWEGNWDMELPSW